MRSLCLLLGIVSCLAVLATGDPAAPTSVAADVLAHPTEVPEEAVFLLAETERVRLEGDISECAALHPVPLYEGAPSSDSWEAYCRARFSSDSGSCAGLPGMLVPDLRSSCIAASDVPSAH